MFNIALKTLCVLSASFGAFILFFVFVAYLQGAFGEYNAGTVVLKVVSTVIRASFLLSCAWFAWCEPKYIAWFAWGAFAAFVVGGAADQIYYLGFIKGLNNLMVAYYVVAIIHAIFAILVWFLSRKVLASAAAKG